MLAATSAIVAEIPIQVEQNQILIPVNVGASGQLTFLLDTGAEGTVIGSDQVQGARLSGGHSSSGTAQGGEITTRLYKGVQVRAGSLSLGKMNIAAVDLAGLSAGTGRHIDGILGYEFFHDRVIRIDYARRRVLVLRSGAPMGRGLPLALTVRGKVPFISAQLDQGRGAARGRLLVDTGAVGALNLYAQFLEANPRLRPARSLALTSGAILPGQFAAMVGRLQRVATGALSIRNVVANFSSNAAADDAAPGDAGLIGGSVLSRYTVTLDYSRGRAVLAPTAGAFRPFDFDASGLSLVAADPSFKSKKVRLVLNNSPAAEAGLKAGDMLVSVAGRSASELTLAELRQLFRRIGATYEIQVQRGDKRLSTQLATRRLI